MTLSGEVLPAPRKLAGRSSTARRGKGGGDLRVGGIDGAGVVGVDRDFSRGAGGEGEVEPQVLASVSTTPCCCSGVKEGLVARTV